MALFKIIRLLFLLALDTVVWFGVVASIVCLLAQSTAYYNIANWHADGITLFVIFVGFTQLFGIIPDREIA